MIWLFAVSVAIGLQLELDLSVQTVGGQPVALMSQERRSAEDDLLPLAYDTADVIEGRCAVVFPRGGEATVAFHVAEGAVQATPGDESEAAACAAAQVAAWPADGLPAAEGEVTFRNIHNARNMLGPPHWPQARVDGVTVTVSDLDSNTSPLVHEPDPSASFRLLQVTKAHVPALTQRCGSLEGVVGVRLEISRTQVAATSNQPDSAWARCAAAAVRTWPVQAMFPLEATLGFEDEQSEWDRLVTVPAEMQSEWDRLVTLSVETTFVEPSDDLAGARAPAPPVRPRGSVALAPGPSVVEGGDREDLALTVRRYKGHAYACYEERLREHPQLAGRVELRWTFDAGRVTAVVLVSDSTGDEELADCLRAKVERWRFPDLAGETTYVFEFTPAE